MPNKEWPEVKNCVYSCALTGTAAFFSGIPNADIIANGPMWCYFYALRPLEKVDRSVTGRFTATQPDSNAIVFGTESYLSEELQRRKKEARKPELLVVENSCSVSLIGDDIEGIVKGASLDYLTLSIDTGGLKGGFSKGYEIAGLKLFEKLQLSRTKVLPRTVNLLGATPFYYNGENDFNEIKRLLELCNLRILTAPGCGSTLAELKNIANADYNIVLNEELGLEQAIYLKEKYQMPYVSRGLPYGLEGTFSWLRELPGVSANDLSKAKEEFMRLADKLFYYSNETRMAWQELWFDKVIVSAPATIAISMAKALRLELLDTKRLVVMAQNASISIEPSAEIDVLYWAPDEGEKIEKELQSFTEGLLLGSSSERELLSNRYGIKSTALNIANPSVEETVFTDMPFVGFRGIMYLAEKLWQLKISGLVNGGNCE